MELVMPRYKILYSPRQKLGGFGIGIQLPKGFPDFVKPLKFDEESYEGYGRELLETHEFTTDLADICDWKKGLLHHIRVPGNCSGLAIHLDGINAPVYLSDNIDNPRQMSMALAIMVRYLLQVESRFLSSLG